MTREDQLLLARVLGSTAAYLIYRRLGAPRWVAVMAVDLALRLELLPGKLAK